MISPAAILFTTASSKRRIFPGSGRIADDLGISGEGKLIEAYNMSFIISWPLALYQMVKEV